MCVKRAIIQGGGRHPAYRRNEVSHEILVLAEEEPGENPGLRLEIRVVRGLQHNLRQCRLSTGTCLLRNGLGLGAGGDMVSDPVCQHVLVL